MTYDNGILTCKSSEAWYELERSGKKPNTIRIVPVRELLALGQCKRVRVKTTDETDFFERDITGIFDITEVANPLVAAIGSSRVICICWDHEAYVHDVCCGCQHYKAACTKRGPRTNDNCWMVLEAGEQR